MNEVAGRMGEKSLWAITPPSICDMGDSAADVMHDDDDVPLDLIHCSNVHKEEEEGPAPVPSWGALNPAACSLAGWLLVNYTVRASVCLSVPGVVSARPFSSSSSSCRAHAISLWHLLTAPYSLITHFIAIAGRETATVNC